MVKHIQVGIDNVEKRKHLNLIIKSEIVFRCCIFQLNLIQPAQNHLASTFYQTTVLTAHKDVK